MTAPESPVPPPSPPAPVPAPQVHAPPSVPAPAAPSVPPPTPRSSAPKLPRPDTTGLYALAGLAFFALSITAVILLFCDSPNPFLQTIFLPHFFRFGFYGEILLMALGIYAGYRHTARLTLRHRILRALWLALILGSLAGQYQLHLLWLMH